MSNGLPVSRALQVVDRWHTALSGAAGDDKRLSQTDRSAARTAHPQDAAALDHFVTSARDVSGTTITVADLDAVATSTRAALAMNAGANGILSQAERARLPMLARLAAAAAAGGAVLPSVDVARAWAEGRDFRGIWRSTLETDRDAASLPDAVKQSVRAWREWENADLGSVSVYAVKNTLPGLFAVHTTTDGDDGFLELFDEQGRALVSGTTTITADAAGALRRSVQWDARFGDARAALVRLQPGPGATFQSRFDAAFQAATGAPIAPTVTTVSETSAHIDLTLALGAATADARMVRVGGRDELTVSRLDVGGPVQSAGMTTFLQSALRADPRFSDATVLAFGQRSTLSESFFSVLFSSGGQERTARLGLTGGTLGPAVLGPVSDDNTAREMAIALATEEALRRASSSGPLAQLEVLARTFNGGARLQAVEPAAAERIRFDAARDHKQVRVSGLWGTAGAAVTFTKAGGHRVDWIV